MVNNLILKFQAKRKVRRQARQGGQEPDHHSGKLYSAKSTSLPEMLTTIKKNYLHSGSIVSVPKGSLVLWRGMQSISHSFAALLLAPLYSSIPLEYAQILKSSS